MLVRSRAARPARLAVCNADSRQCFAQARQGEGSPSQVLPISGMGLCDPLVNLTVDGGIRISRWLQRRSRRNNPVPERHVFLVELLSKPDRNKTASNTEQPTDRPGDDVTSLTALLTTLLLASPRLSGVAGYSFNTVRLRENSLRSPEREYIVLVTQGKI